MRKFILAFLIVLMAAGACHAVPTVWFRNALTGGSDSLDDIDGDDLEDGYAALVVTASGAYLYSLDASSGAAESSPGVISPDSNAGSKRWILQDVFGDDIVSVGELGVGTSAPGNPIDVITGGTTNSVAHFGEAVDEGAYLTSTVDNQAVLSGGAELVANSWTARSTVASLIGTGSTGIKFYTDASLTDGNTFTPSTRMTITTGGDVGIGTDSPIAQLEIFSSSDADLRGLVIHQDSDDNKGANYIQLKTRATGQHPSDSDQLGNIHFAFYNDAGTPELIKNTTIWALVDDYTDGTEDTSFHHRIYDDGAQVEMITIKNSMVGINNSSPANVLDVTTGATTNSAVHIGEAANEGAYITSINDGQAALSGGAELVSGNWTARATEATIFVTGSTGLTIYSDASLTDGNTFSPSARMRVGTDGKVGVGTTSPYVALEVNGAVKVGNDATACSANLVGAVRYSADASSATLACCMQTGAATYAWTTVKQNTW